MGLFSGTDGEKKALVESAYQSIEAGDKLGAMRSLQKAIDIDPEFKKAHAAMGFLFPTWASITRRYRFS